MQVTEDTECHARDSLEPFLKKETYLMRASIRKVAGVMLQIADACKQCRAALFGSIRQTIDKVNLVLIAEFSEGVGMPRRSRLSP